MLLDCGKKIIITIIHNIDNIEITIIQTIIFEFENMMQLFSIFQKKIFVTDLSKFPLKK